ncbi:hypothetical protein [Flavobacterium sp. C4GT6]|uniref:hypothetical protein n=1 Tax=Flavobacterium sp. C4GT6 TaxID=3103818 RepID=UPI002ED645D0
MENITLKIIIPSIAVSVSLVSLYISMKISKRNIRISKLEEILEIFFFLQVTYSSVYEMASIILHFKNEVSKGNVYTNLLDKFKTDKKEHLENYKDEYVAEKVARLYVLTNAYITDKKNNYLRMRIRLFIDLIIAMNEVIEDEGESIPLIIKNSLPDNTKISPLCDEIENDIIKEMGLGHKNLNRKNYETYKKKMLQTIMLPH